jgi:eukaryotic-like serine/threonine-protein kinase
LTPLPNPTDSPRLRRFDQFELDLRTGEIYKQGRRIKLQDQPCQVLALLVERPGELVTREELQKKLWPNDTFVDFDHGVNLAINKLRGALGDSAEKPRFIETLPRRGYRWIAPVEHVEAGFAKSQAEIPVAAPELKGAMSPSVGKRDEARRWKVFIPVGVLVIAIAGVAYLSAHRVTPLSEKDTIVLADFENKTGDPVFDDTLKQGLFVALQQSPFINLVSDRRLAQTLKMMKHPPSEPVTGNVARELCQRVSGKALLEGSISPLGRQYVIALNAIDCLTGDALVKTQEQASGKENVLKVLGNEVTTLRTKLGESLTKVQKYDTPIEDATTPSLGALKAYSLGVKTLYATGETAALPWFKHAVELDPVFAMAYERMGVVYGNLSEVGLSRESHRKAYELRKNVSEGEQFAINQGYYSKVTGQLHEYAENAVLWQQTYPNDDRAQNSLGIIYIQLGNGEKSLEEMLEALRRDPGNINAYINVASGYANLNRLDEAEKVFKQAEERHLESELSLAVRYQLAFLKADSAEMARLAAAASGKPGAEDVLLAFEAKTEAWHGRADKARDLTQRAVASAVHNDSKETAAYYEAEGALREAELGNRQQARRDANAALRLGVNRDIEAMTALALVRAGDIVEAEKLVKRLDQDFPLDTLVQNYWLPSIRAAVELEHNNPGRAITLLQAAAPYELSEPTLWEGFLYPIYLRGEAYLQLRNGDAAAVEFQKFVDHRGLVANFHLGSLSRLGLARAYALLGHLEMARGAYEEFLTLWRDADSDILVLKEAKAEYAKLQ